MDEQKKQLEKRIKTLTETRRRDRRRLEKIKKHLKPINNVLEQIHDNVEKDLPKE